MNKNRWLAVVVSLLFGVIVLFYLKQTYNASKDVTKANTTAMQIDSMRFVFKSMFLLQEARIALKQTQEEHSEDKYYDTLDYLDACVGFLDTQYLDTLQPLQKSVQKIEHLSHSLQNAGYEINKQDFIRYDKDIQRIAQDLNKVGELLWFSFEKQYFALQVNEAKLIRQYEIIVVLILFALAVLGWFARKQSVMYFRLQEQKQQLADLAYYDTLTGIPNRKSIENIIHQYIEAAKRKNEGFYIALIDMDDFKKVNDLFGHEEGDKFLQESVRRIHECVRINDILGRFGGDEFVLVFQSSLNVVEIEIVLDRINKAFAEPIVLGRSAHYTNASIGVVHYPQNSMSVAELMKFADVAMYKAKQLGKGRYVFFEDTFSEKLQAQYKIEPQIKKAIESNQFELYYQPQIASTDGKVQGVEALVRWNHPEEGFLTPDKFIEIIESGFMTKEFGEWVIRQAARQQKIWQREGIDLSVSVNLSAKHVMMASFFDDITALVKELRVDLSRFYFEITEYELMGYKDRSIEVLNKLAELGFLFELDDFGTGYSSITYLNQVPFKAVKIDKKFVDEIGTSSNKNSLVDAIINMSQALNIEVIAEGVETQEQFEYLKSAGCQIIQGYFFAKPMSVVDIKQYYKNS